MKKLFLFASLSALLAAMPALAADDNHDRHDNQGAPPPAHAEHGGDHMGGPAGHMAGPAGHPAGPAAHVAAPNHMAAPTGPMSGPIAPTNHGAMGTHRDHMQGAAVNHMQPAVNNAMAHTDAHSNMDRHDMGRTDMGRNRTDHSNADHNNTGHNNMGRSNTSHGGNFASLHRNFTAPRRYHAGSYHRPHGYYAHRWSYGERLPTIFFARNYWINDFDEYGLMDPPPGTVWVRYGDDALLIDEYTGEVIQVEYGIFY